MTPVNTREDLAHLVSVARRALGAWWLIGVITMLGSALALGVALVRQRVYRSETLMLYREGIRATDLVGGDAAGEPARKLGLKLKEKVLSRTSLRHIIEELHLYPAIVEERGYVDAVDEMRSRISFRVRDGDTFGLSFEGTSPHEVQAVTARLAEMLVRDNSSNRLAQATSTKEFLDEERDKSERNLRAREHELAQFLTEHPEFAREAVIGAGAATPEAAPSHHATASDPTLTALERGARRIERQLGVPEVPSPPRHASEERRARDPALVIAETELTSARQELESRRARFTEQHPDVVAARRQVSTLEARLRTLASGSDTPPPAAPAESTISAASSPPPVDRAELTRSLGRIRSEIASYRGIASEKKKGSIADATHLVALETRSTLLNREVAEAREWQKQVADRQFRADITASSVAANPGAQMEILDPAFLPTHPANGGRTLIVLIGFLASLALGLLVATARALLDDRIHARGDLERLSLGELLVEIAREAPLRARALRGSSHHG